MKMKNWLFKLDYLSPTGFIGFWVLIIGLLLTGTMFYFVFFRLGEDNQSYNNRKRYQLALEKQKEKIARLYPKGNEN